MCAMALTARFFDESHLQFGRTNKEENAGKGSFVSITSTDNGKRTWALQPVDSKGKQSFYAVAGIVASLFQDNGAPLDQYTQVTASDENNFKETIKSLNGKIYEVRSHFCLPMRFLISILNGLPNPIEGKAKLLRGDTVLNVDYMQDAFEHHNKCMQAARNGSSHQHHTSLFPFLAVTIDYYAAGQMHVNDGSGQFSSRFGRGALALAVVASLAYALVIPIVQIIALVKHRKSWPEHYLLLTPIDIALGIILSPLFSLVVSIKSLAGAIIHPGIVFTNLS